MLLVHLLKWHLQRSRRSRAWHATIVTQRQEIEDLLEQSPSLRPKLASALNKNYARAVQRARAETGLGRGRFSSDCPFTFDQILDPEFLPR